MAKFVALLRGINVGTAKQVPMAELKRAFENLGALNVRTLLRSGNVVFESNESIAAAAVEAELLKLTGVQASVLVLAAEQFVQVAKANPLTEVATDGSKLFVTFLSGPPGKVVEPDAETLAPEILRVGPAAIYQWFPDGSMNSRVPKSFWGQLSRVQTARNANTVEKILTLLSEETE